MKAGQDPSGNFLLTAMEAADGRPAGERHLLGVVERGRRGLTIATVGIGLVDEDGCTSFPEIDSFTFESRDEARAFVSAWVWYRVVKREGRR